MMCNVCQKERLQKTKARGVKDKTDAIELNHYKLDVPSPQ